MIAPARSAARHGGPLPAASAGPAGRPTSTAIARQATAPDTTSPRITATSASRRDRTDPSQLPSPSALTLSPDWRSPDRSGAARRGVLEHQRHEIADREDAHQVV